jgi:hypothetical protein
MEMKKRIGIGLSLAVLASLAVVGVAGAWGPYPYGGYNPGNYAYYYPPAYQPAPYYSAPYYSTPYYSAPYYSYSYAPPVYSAPYAYSAPYYGTYYFDYCSYYACSAPATPSHNDSDNHHNKPDLNQLLANPAVRQFIANQNGDKHGHK